jgi:hypothetical protein
VVATVPVSFADIQNAFEYVNVGLPGETQAFLDRENGKIHYHSELLDGDEDEPLPDDLGAEKYLEIPHKLDLGLGKHLAFQFADEFMSADRVAVRDFFRRKGGYRRFKDLLDRRDLLQRWYDFSSEAENAALRAWCTDCEVELGD